MAQTNIRAYDADSRYPEFLGLSQYGDDINTDQRYSPDAVNVDTPGGVLQPFARNIVFVPTLEYPIESLMHLYKRWPADDEDRDLLVAASHGKLYSMEVGDVSWTEVGMPEGITSFQSSVWSWVNYEFNSEESESPIDVLLISNSKDGMYMVSGNPLTAIYVETPWKFGVIERYAERIWGGAIEDEPDKLAYSRTYDATDWSEYNPEDLLDQPENASGDINQPSWDGDSFMALRSFGSQLIAFKRTRVWRIMGTDPGEYTFKEQFGGGAPLPNTIAVDAERILMMSSTGVQVYDGNTVAPFRQQMACKIWNRLNPDALDQAVACLYQQHYFLAVSLVGDDGSSDTCNNAVMIYNATDDTWLLRTGIYVESWLPTENHLYYTTGKQPGQVCEYRMNAWNDQTADEQSSKWITPWQDFNYKNMQKGPFDVYFTVELGEHPVDFTFTLQTEKRSRSKEIRVHPILDWQKRFNKRERTMRIAFAGTSAKRFRLIIETKKKSPVWRLVGGILIKADIAYD